MFELPLKLYQITGQIALYNYPSDLLDKSKQKLVDVSKPIRTARGIGEARAAILEQVRLRHGFTFAYWDKVEAAEVVEELSNQEELPTDQFLKQLGAPRLPGFEEEGDSENA